MQQKLIVGWDTFLRDCSTLVHMLHSMTPFDCIAAVTRGGLFPAGIIARALDIRYIDTVCIALYDDDCRQAESEVLKGIDRAVSQSNRWLVIDEIADSGRTARVARKMMPAGSVFASVYAKPEGMSNVDVYAVPVSQETWLVMPWES